MTAPALDNYIARAAPFAQPILRHVRATFARVCPELEESLKWSHPSFGYRGNILAAMAAFKSHVRFRFWQCDVLPDPHQIFSRGGESEPGALKLASLADLPADAVLEAYIAQAMLHVEVGAKAIPRAAKPPKSPKLPLAAPADLLAALQAEPKAEKTFAALSPSQRREYIEWVVEAKREATRLRRVQTALEWLGAGKSFYWKYERSNQMQNAVAPS